MAEEACPTSIFGGEGREEIQKGRGEVSAGPVSLSRTLDRTSGIKVERFLPNFLGSIDDGSHLTSLAFCNIPPQVISVLVDQLKIATHRISPRISVKYENVGTISDVHPASPAVDVFKAHDRIASIVEPAAKTLVEFGLAQGLLTADLLHRHSNLLLFCPAKKLSRSIEVAPSHIIDTNAPSPISSSVSPKDRSLHP